MKKNKYSKEKIIEIYKNILLKTNKRPTRASIIEAGVTRDAFRSYFGNMIKLHEYVNKNHANIFENLLDESHFTPQNFKKVVKNVQKKKRFFVTTAVTGHSVNQKFLNVIKNYCQKMNAELLIIPIEDPASKGPFSYSLDPCLKTENIVFKDLKLNNNILIRTIKLSAKQLDPTTGLDRLGKREGSFIFGSPKQFLKVTPTTRKYPHLILTTGAITNPEYMNTKSYFSQRTAYLANYDHILGGLIVEIRDHKIYHVRGVEADSKTGKFIDLGIEYTQDKTRSVGAKAFSLGDLHPYQMDESAFQAWENICKEIKVENLILHDAFDGMSISHHDYKKSITNAKKHAFNALSLNDELDKSIEVYKRCLNMVKNKVYFARSNHDEVIDRYLQEGRYVFDPQNLYLASQMVAPMIDGWNPFHYALEKIKKIQHKGRMIFLERDEELNFCGVELGQHGDKGANGGRASVRSFERAYEKCVVGHSHTPCIYRGVYVNGTTSKLRMDYNSGPSSWLHASTLVYYNGARQLIIAIDGKTHL